MTDWQFVITAEAEVIPGEPAEENPDTLEACEETDKEETT